MRYLTILPLIICVAGHANPVGRGPAPDSDVPAYAEIQMPDPIRVAPFAIGARTGPWCPGAYPKREIEYRWDRIPFGGDVNKIRQDHNDAVIRSVGTEFGMLGPNKTYAIAFNVWYWGAGDATACFVDANAADPSEEHQMSLLPSMGATCRVSLLLTSDGHGTARMEFRAKGRCALALNEFVHIGCPADLTGGGKR
ncbi:MAG: hypothetical protein M1133_16585 [Armatimonadetes bacterium]|nr:hypothetical protein [Armatimonadota bacterium]